MRETGSLRQPVEEMLRLGKSVDQVLEFLRNEGCSKIDSMWLLEDVAGMTGVDAKKAVHFSPVWAEVRTRDEHFHDALEDELKREGQS